MKKIKIKKRNPRIQKNQIRIKIQKNLKIESSYIRTNSLFNGAYSANWQYDALKLDTTKIENENNYHIYCKK